MPVLSLGSGEEGRMFNYISSVLLELVGELLWVGGVCCICLHVIYFHTSFIACPAHAKLIDSLHTQQVLLLVLLSLTRSVSYCRAASITLCLSSLFISVLDDCFYLVLTLRLSLC